MKTETDGVAGVVRDGEGRSWEVGEVTAPAAWATALVNADWSGLEADPEDAAACRAWIAGQAEDGWRVVDVRRGEGGDAEDPWFSSIADLHGSPYVGTDLLTYIRERRVAAAQQ